MERLSILEARIDGMIATVDEDRATHQEHIRRRMLELSRSHELFNQAATTVMATVIRPCLEMLTRKFDNAAMVQPETAGGHRLACAFGHTDRFPASTTVEFGIGPDDQVERMLVSYRLEILPVFISFKGQDQLAMPLDCVDESAIATWVDERTSEFVETYLKLETAKAYQQDNMETDPVCGMPVNPTWAAARKEYGGRMYYFCIDECRQKFANEPERFAAKKAGVTSMKS